MVEIPPDRLAPHILDAVIEEFITREGTDYGEQSFTLAEKVEQVKTALKRGQAVIVFDEESESTTIVTREGR